MKYFLFITTLLLSLTLFLSNEKEMNCDEQIMKEREAIMQDRSMDIPYRLEVLSKDMRSNNFLTPRRNVQSTNYHFNTRIMRHAVKLLYDIRIKGTGRLQKISEHISFCQTINYSSLLCRKGYHIYALRKLII
ncbi:MAG: hypothetical protein LUG51_16045 [Tannerellaceae bacterium]|nr:hypothetical protein [Tannerellaceae bacterium]